MELAEPPPTQYDIQFNVGKIPVRIHPLFWVVTLILGASGSRSAVGISMWIAAVLVSILVHELGHALAAKAYGWPPRITLYGMGGLAAYNPGSRQTWKSRALIAFAGPGAGFVLAALVIGIVLITGHAVALPPFPIRIGAGPLLTGRIGQFVLYMAFVNVFWGLINLVPVQPLDGGAILQSLLNRFRPRDALGLSYQVSMVTAGVLAAVALLMLNSMFMAVMFGLLGYQSWHTLQQLKAAGYV